MRSRSARRSDKGWTDTDISLFLRRQDAALCVASENLQRRVHLLNNMLYLPLLKEQCNLPSGRHIVDSCLHFYNFLNWTELECLLHYEHLFLNVYFFKNEREKIKQFKNSFMLTLLIVRETKAMHNKHTII